MRVVSTTAALVAVSALAGCTSSKIEGRFTDKVTTVVSPVSIQAGEMADATCTIWSTFGDALPGRVELDVVPFDGLVRQDEAPEGATARFMGVKVGTYAMHCRAPELGLFDAVGATLEVRHGPPAKITTILEEDTIPLGQKTRASCVVEDAWGNLIGMETTVTAEEGVAVSGVSLTGEAVGDFEVRCEATDPEAAPDAEIIPATLTVEYGEPASVELVAKPAWKVYSVMDEVTLSWIVKDEYGNEIPDVPGSIEKPQGLVYIVDAAKHRYSLEAEGAWTFWVTLDPPWDHLKDDLTLYVDESGPDIVITWPERGATLQGEGEPIHIEGQVSDALGAVDWLTIGGEEVEIAEDGTFETDMEVAWGVNVIFAEAADEFGNVGKLTPTFQYSSDYTPFVDESAQGVKEDDAIAVLLGQDFFDDGVHDYTEVDDIATLLEMFLAGFIDLDAILPTGPLFEQVLPLPGFTLPIPGVGDVTIETEALLTVQIAEESGLGPLWVGIDSRPGGIDTSITFGTESEPGFGILLEIIFEAPISTTIEVLGFPVEVTGMASATATSAVTIDELGFLVDLDIHKDVGSPIDIHIGTFELLMDNFSIDPLEDIVVAISVDIPFLGSTELFSLNLSDFFDIGALLDGLLDPLTNSIAPMINGFIEPLVQTFVSDILAGIFDFLEFDTSFPIPDLLGGGGEPTNLDIYTNLDSVVFDDPGGHLALGLGTWSDKGTDREPLGAIQRDGCLIGSEESLNYGWEHSIGFALKTDAVNALLFSVWWSGFLDGGLDLGALTGGGGGGLPVDGLELDLYWLLPPILNDCSKLAGFEIEIGDLYAKIDGNALGVPIDGEIYVDLGLVINFEAQEDGLYITIGQLKYMDVEVISVADVPVLGDFIDVEDLLENQLGGLLEGFIVGESFGPIEIPAFDLAGLVPGAPPEASFQIGGFDISTQLGYVIAAGDLQ